MRKLSRAISVIVLIVAASAFAVYKAEDAQHRNPSPPSSGQTRQPPAARPAPPQGGHTAAPNAPKTGQAVPRPPAEARNQPDHRRPPQHGPLIIPYPVGPWWYPWPYPYPPYGGWRVYAEWQTANIRIDVTPNDAQVYVDGYYAGIVDDFDGVFQHLTVRAGSHVLEIRRVGYRSLAFEVSLYPGESITYRRAMEPATAEPGGAPAAPLPPAFEEGAALPAPPEGGPSGDMKFDVSPANAEIYVDGFYSGIVDDFNGSRHLQLPAGAHHVSLTMRGYETIEVDVTIEPEKTLTYRATMKNVR